MAHFIKYIGCTDPNQISMNFLSFDYVLGSISVKGTNKNYSPKIKVGTPASATAPGVTGEVMCDATYFYYCYATNSWARLQKVAW